MKFKNRYFSILAASLLIGCGVSPLMNHVTPGSGKSPANTQDKADCPLRFNVLGLCASFSWVKLPENTKGVFTLRFWNSKTSTALGPYSSPEKGQLAVIPEMPEHGHGSDEAVKIFQEKDADGQLRPGEFVGKNVKLTMPGTWKLHIQINEGEKTLDQAEVTYVLAE